MVLWGLPKSRFAPPLPMIFEKMLLANQLEKE
jgi:hypothetical protein